MTTKKTTTNTTRPARSNFAAAIAEERAATMARKVAMARERFLGAATAKGWDVRARDGLDDYFEEKTFYAWLGWRAAATGEAL
jgi:hypothetical protein